MPILVSIAIDQPLLAVSSGNRITETGSVIHIMELSGDVTLIHKLCWGLIDRPRRTGMFQRYGPSLFLFFASLYRNLARLERRKCNVVPRAPWHIVRNARYAATKVTANNEALGLTFADGLVWCQIL